MPARYRAILIAGPTASGKSALALAAWRRFGGLIVNADSMQVYRDIPVIGAQPPAADLAEAPHRLYGHVDAAVAHSVGAWRAEFDALEPPPDGGPLIVTGGTGLYFSALTEGLAPVPPVAAEVRARWRAALAALGARALHAELAARDPAMARRLEPADGVRIVRALEVMEATGRSLADWQAMTRPGPLPAGDAGVLAVLVVPPAPALAAVIAGRFDAMMRAGAAAEVARLVARGLDPALPAMNAIGVRPLADHLAGRIGEAEAVDRAVTATRQYAKRQRTWFRGRFGPEWHRFSSAGEAEMALLGADHGRERSG